MGNFRIFFLGEIKRTYFIFSSSVFSPYIAGTREEGGVWMLGVHQDADLGDPQAEDGVVHPKLSEELSSVRFKVLFREK